MFAWVVIIWLVVGAVAGTTSKFWVKHRQKPLKNINQQPPHTTQSPHNHHTITITPPTTYTPSHNHTTHTHTTHHQRQILYARAYTHEAQLDLLAGVAARMVEEPFRLLVVDSVMANFRCVVCVCL